MPPGRSRYFRNNEEDRFETEAFAYLNEDETEDSKPENEQESVVSEDSEPEDVQEKQGTESDDEAPDDVGFHDSRQSALLQLRSAIRQVDAEKQKKKKKRKELQTQFIEQKAKKQKELASVKLPEDFLDSIDDTIPKKIPKTEGKRYEDGGKRRKSHKKRKAVVSEVNPATQPVKRDRRTADYISFTDRASGVQVSDLKFIEKQSKTIAQIAADFKHNMLYGKHVKRESNQKRLAKKEKRRHRLR